MSPERMAELLPEISARMREVEADIKERQRRTRRFLSQCICPETCYFHTPMDAAKWHRGRAAIGGEQ